MHMGGKGPSCFLFHAKILPCPFQMTVILPDAEEPLASVCGLQQGSK